MSAPASGRVIPELSLVVLIGASGSGKSTFARAHFAPDRGHLQRLLPRSGRRRRERPVGQPGRFDVLHFIAAKRLAAGRLTVIDATNVQPESRRS